MQRIVQRKNYLLVHDLNASRVWDQNIDIEFTPDELNVKSVTYVNNPLQYNTDYLTSDLVNYEVLCCVSDAMPQHNPTTSFLLAKQVRKTYHFEVRQEDNTVSVGTGILMVQLEFVQFEK